MNGEFAALKAIVTADTAQYERAMARAATTGRTTASIISRAGNQMSTSLGNTANGWNRMGRSAEDAARRHQNAMRGMQQSAVFAAKAAGILAIGLGAASVAVGAVGVKFNVLKQRAQVAFATMLGSSSAANKFLNQLQAFAARTPFQFQDLIPASQRMMAMGIAAKNVIPYLTAIGNAEALLGGGSLGIDRVTLAIGQMQAKTKVTAEEMRQLTEAGIPAWKYLAQAMHMTVAQVMKLSQEGKVSAKTGIAGIIAGMQRDFGGGMAKLNKTLEGQWSNLKDSLQAAAGTLFLPVMPVLLHGVQAVNKRLGEFITTEFSGRAPYELKPKTVIHWAVLTQTAADAASSLWSAIQAAVNDQKRTITIGGGTGLATSGFPGQRAPTMQAPIPRSSIQDRLMDSASHIDWGAVGKRAAVGIVAFWAAVDAAIVAGTAGVTQAVASTISKAFTNPAALKGPIASAASFVTSNWKALLLAGLGPVGAAMVGGLAGIASVVLSPARRIGASIVHGISSGISGAWGAVTGVLSRITGFIASVAGSAAGAALRLGSGIVHAVSSGLSGIGGAVASKMSGVVGGIVSVVSSAYGAAVGLGRSIAGGVLSGIGGLASSIASSIGSAVSSAISSAKSAAAGLIPHKAAGGVVNGPQLAVVGEGRGREFIIPDDPKYRRRAMGLFQQAGHALGVPGYAAGGVAGRPGARAYTPRYNWKRFRRSSLDSEQATAADYDAQTQRWDRYFNRDGTLDAKEEGIMISRMTRYRSMLDRISSKAGVIARRDRAAAKHAKDPQRRSDLLNAAGQASQTSHDTHQASLDLAQDIADRVTNRNALLHPAAADLASKLARYDDLDALIQAGMGPKGLTQAQNLLNELHYLKTVKGFGRADIARAINDVSGRLAGLDTGGGGAAAAAAPIQSQIDAATNAGFASGFGRLWSNLTGGLGDIGAGQGVTLAVDRLLLAPTPPNYQTMANGANAGNDAQAFRIYSPVSSVGAP